MAQPKSSMEATLSAESWHSLNGSPIVPEENPRPVQPPSPIAKRKAPRICGISTKVSLLILYFMGFLGSSLGVCLCLEYLYKEESPQISRASCLASLSFSILGVTFSILGTYFIIIGYGRGILFNSAVHFILAVIELIIVAVILAQEDRIGKDYGKLYVTIFLSLAFRLFIGVLSGRHSRYLEKTQEIERKE